MGNFKQGNGNRFGRGNKSGFGKKNTDKSFRPDNKDRIMYKAICDECGEDCELPFRPTGDKPVYCKSCFEKKKGIGGDRRNNRFPQNRFGGQKNNFRENAGRENNDELKKQLVILNGKMDQLIGVIEEMASAKPEKEKAAKKKPAAKKPVKKAPKKKKK